MIGKFITHCEDSLTASVFTHLLHLPVELFWRIIGQACYSAQLPDCVGELDHVTFWPVWSAEGIADRTRVIPDLFMRFTKLDLIIEAKRWDEGMQRRTQWEEQLYAYANEYPRTGEATKVRIIALGGIWGTRDEEVIIPSRAISCTVHMCRWAGVLTECKRMERELSQTRYPSSQTHAHRRILLDVIGLFPSHGFQTGEWFRDMVPNLQPLNHSIQRHHDVFQKLSAGFRCL